jgi:serine/threonine protein kinase
VLRLGLELWHYFFKITFNLCSNLAIILTLILTLTLILILTLTLTLVHLAIDHDSTLENKNVALKFMRHRDQFLREINVRGVCGFDEKYVIGAIRVHDSAEDADFHEEVVAKGFQNFPYCFVMQVGERNLTDIMIKEHIAGRDWNQVISLVSQIASAVGHMHEKGFVHGDLKRK